MYWLGFLFQASLVVQITGNMVVLFCIYPAYKITKHRAFLLLIFAFLIGTFDTICDHTIGLQSMEPKMYIAYRTIRKFAYFADAVLLTWGMVSLCKSYLELVKSKNTETVPANTSPGISSH